MITVEKIATYNWENAVRGARNPMNSWQKMDSVFAQDAWAIGPGDLELLRKLCRAGSDHRKFMRQIFVSMDITAPLYWWKEFDTYKVGTVANSTSTMHRIHARPFSLDDFSHDRMSGEAMKCLEGVVAFLEQRRLRFVETKDKALWWDIIQMLPSSYHQLRTCSLNYENLLGIYRARKDHKLDEWRAFCREIEELPYAEDLICI